MNEQHLILQHNDVLKDLNAIYCRPFSSRTIISRYVLHTQISHSISLGTHLFFFFATPFQPFVDYVYCDSEKKSSWATCGSIS